MQIKYINIFHNYSKIPYFSEVRQGGIFAPFSFSGTKKGVLEKLNGRFRGREASGFQNPCLCPVLSAVVYTVKLCVFSCAALSIVLSN